MQPTFSQSDFENSKGVKSQFKVTLRQGDQIENMKI